MLMRITTLVLCLSAGAAQAGDLPASACKAPAHTPETSRYEMQGTTRLSVTVTPEGKASNVRMLTSSGWPLLDDSAVKLSASCQFGKAAGEGTLAFTWPAVSGPPVRPVLLTNSCRKSLLRPVAADAPEANLRLRLMVWTDGKVYAPRVDRGSGDAKIDSWAADLIHSCRYTPASRDGVAVPGTALIGFAYDRKSTEEPALRALYERLLPKYRQALAGQNEYQVTFKYKDDEAQARAELARIANGGPFFEPNAAGKPSLLEGMPRKWLRPAANGKTLSETLRKVTRPGLLPDPVESDKTWVIMRVDAVRRAEPASFEVMQPILKAALVAGVDLETTETP